MVFSAFFPSTNFNTFRMNFNDDVKVLEDGVFGAVSFESLSIQYSALETIGNYSLASSRSTLRSIQIIGCQVAAFPFERLSEFTSLERLRLDSNNISSLPRLHSSSIEYLDLSENPISHLSTDVFTGLQIIGEIDLSKNHLREIKPGKYNAWELWESVHGWEVALCYCVFFVSVKFVPF